MIEDHNPNKLNTLINYISPGVFQLISDTYDGAIATLESIFIRKKNEIFARHLLATRRQKSGETLNEYIQELKVLAKDINFKSLTAEQNKDMLYVMP